MGASILLEWQHVSHAFNGVPALSDVTLRVPRGALCCLMGPNGAGKTTLLKTAAGLLSPRQGRVLIEGQSLYPSNRRAQSQIGVLLGDGPGAYDPLGIRENLRFFGALQGLYGARLRARVDELLGLLGLEAPEKPFQACASGIKQRALLARAVLHDPPLLLLDEPTSHLDAAWAVAVRALLKQRQAQGNTIVFTTHDPAEAQALAQQVVRLDRGQVTG